MTPRKMVSFGIFSLQGNGHREDILSVAQCPPNLLATSSYDGEVIVWNMVSGHIFCHLRAAPPAGYEDQTCAYIVVYITPINNIVI